MALSTRDRRALLLLGGVMVVAAIAYFLFVSGGSKKAVPSSAVGTTGSIATVPTTPTPTPSTSPTPSENAEEKLVFTGRDPFQPVGANVVTVPPASESPSVSPAGSPPSGPTGGSSTSIGGHTVVLIDIFTSGGANKAQVEVDGTVYTGGVGDSFSDNFMLESIDDGCADFLFGDDPFTLCESANK